MTDETPIDPADVPDDPTDGALPQEPVPAVEPGDDGPEPMRAGGSSEPTQ